MQLQHSLILATQQRQDAVRRQLVEGLVEIEVILKLRAFGFLALNNVRAHGAFSEHTLAYFTHQIRVEREAVYQDGPGAVEGLLGVFKALGDKGLCQLFWSGVGIRNELIGQLLKAGFAGNIGLGFAALLIRQIQIF